MVLSEVDNLQFILMLLLVIEHVRDVAESA